MSTCQVCKQQVVQRDGHWWHAAAPTSTLPRSIEPWSSDLDNDHEALPVLCPEKGWVSFAGNVGRAASSRVAGEYRQCGLPVGHDGPHDLRRKIERPV